MSVGLMLGAVAFVYSSLLALQVYGALMARRG